MMIRHRQAQPLLTYLTAGLALAALTACGSTPAPEQPTPAAQDPLAIQAGPDLQRRLTVGTPEWRPISGVIRVAGRVEADATRLARISAPVSGRIVQVQATEGQHVRRGDVLATVYSTELSQAESALLKARTELRVAEQAATRARQLLTAGVIGAAELQRREAEVERVKADVSANLEQLRVLGFSDTAIEELGERRAVRSMAHIVATIDGVVLERHATVGQVVEAVQPVFVIADLSSVWLVADVPERLAGGLRVGQAVEAEIPALAPHTVTGTLSFVSAIVEPETRTVRTRMDLPNPRRLYKPAMLASLTMTDGVERRLVVPGSAVVREADANHVFVQLAEGAFRLQPVTLDEAVGDVRPVLGGLDETERIVLSGAFHLNNERKQRAVNAEGNN